MQLLLKHVQEDLIRPSCRTEQRTSREIDDLVMACLHKDPNQRPRSADEVIQRAAACDTLDTWDQPNARHWWELHLPNFTRPAVADIGARALAYSLALALVLSTASTAVAQTKPRTISTATELSGSLEATTVRVAPAIVEIFTTSYVPGNALVSRTADLVTTERASGSGVLVDPDGYIVTNAHVVRGAQRLRVELPRPAAGNSIVAARGRTVVGEIVGIDLETDLAVIRVNERNLPALTFGDSDEVRPGQLVLAFGSPLGLHNSVSLGVVSAVARQLEPESPMIYLQTDAAINPGSSGGPLVDVNGRIVGINTLIASQAGGNEGLGFAAPSNIVRVVYEQIRKTGRVHRGDIGIRTQTITAELAAGLRLARDYGVVIADVRPGSPAARTGLRPGDVVVSLDGKRMENGRQLQVNLYRRVAGDVVSLEILRDGVTSSVAVALSERQDAVAGLTSIDPRESLVARLGVLGVDLNRDIAALLPVRRVPSGVVVASTVAGAIDARDGGLAAGDVIYAVNRRPVVTVNELRAALDELPRGNPVVLQLERHGELMYLAFMAE